MPKFLVYTIYNLLLPIALLLGFPSFIIKGIRRGGLVKNFWQRLGFFDSGTRTRLNQVGNYWVHAVSVGEVFSALKIINAIHRADPERPVVLTTTTTTGFRVADENADEKTTIIHNPVDCPFVVWRVIRRIRPAKLILVESEIWPNLVAAMKRRKIPVCLVNARLSPGSERRYIKFLPLIEPIFSQIDCVTVPFSRDKKRWACLGISSEIIEDVGSVKFDDSKDEDPPAEQIAELRVWLEENGIANDSPVFLAGSTHDGEETLVTRVWQNLRKVFPDLALVIVPRHAERGGEIADQLEQMGVETALRAGPNRASSSTQQSQGDRVCIANTTGELRAWFFIANVVMIGKSFTGKGGQNPVEPVLAGKPVIVGPNMQNFSDVVRDLVAAEGITQVADEVHLREKVAEFLRHPEKGGEQSANGKKAMARHQGAADRTISVLERF